MRNSILVRRAHSNGRHMTYVRISLWLVASWITTAEADIALWQLGGSGLEWAEHDSVAILIDETTTPGAIQPIYIQPDRSVFSYLTNWGSWTPRELGYVDGERPRVSGNLRLVDGDSTSYLAPSSGGSPDGRTFTFDLAVPVPDLLLRVLYALAGIPLGRQELARRRRTRLRAVCRHP